MVMACGGIVAGAGRPMVRGCGMMAYMTKTVVTAYVERDPESGLHVAVVPGVRGAHTQAESLDELKANLEEGWLTAETAPR